MIAFEVLPLETINVVYPWFLGGMDLGKGTFQRQAIEDLSTLNEILKWKLVVAPQTSSGYLSLGLLHLYEFVSLGEF